MKKYGEKDMYQALGVDSGKANVRKIFSKSISNDYPNAFVNIVRDPCNPNYVMTLHNDGDGSKFLQRLLHYWEVGGGYSVFKGMVDDGLSMNTADIAAAGFVYGNWLVSDILNVAFPKKIKEDLMLAVAERMSELLQLYRRHGLDAIYFLGGETADLPDQVRTGVFDVSVSARMIVDHVIAGNVKPGDVIYGIQSDGRADWEKTDNFGLMANGYTLARSCLMDKSYNKKYPQLARDKKTVSDQPFFRGRFKVGEGIAALGVPNVSEALLSPTRQWAIVIRKLTDFLFNGDSVSELHGISVNTGGGATKIQHLGGGKVTFVKKMPHPPSLVQLIQYESGELWENMQKTFNCGVGLDIVGNDSPQFRKALELLGESCGLKVYKLGYCEKRKSDKSAKVVLETKFGTFIY